MKWAKKGLIYSPNGEISWAKTNASLPTPDIVDSQTIRLYITSCDEKGIGRIGYIDIDANNPSRILKISDKPVLDIGAAELSMKMEFCNAAF